MLIGGEPGHGLANTVKPLKKFADLGSTCSYLWPVAPLIGFYHAANNMSLAGVNTVLRGPHVERA
jgi:hypothetical protein